MRRVLASTVAVSGGISLALLGLVAPAQGATNTNVGIGCGAGPSLTLVGVSSLTGTTNDTFTMTPISGLPGTTISASISGVSGPTSFTSNTSPSPVYTLTGSGGASVVFSVTGGLCSGLSVTMSINGGASASSDSAEAETPPPVLQQFGKAAVGSCDAAQPALLNIGGAESGGWSESWAEWMNGGLGGAVCTRTLVYSNDLGHWVVS